MRFYKRKGKQHLDMTGDLVLTRNKDLCSCSSRSAMPHSVKGGYLLDVSKHRLTATWLAVRFIWTGK